MWVVKQRCQNRLEWEKNVIFLYFCTIPAAKQGYAAILQYRAGVLILKCIIKVKT